jgi:hypothetical protein
MAYFALSQEAEQEAAQNGLGQHSQKIIEQMKKILNAIIAFIRAVLVTSSEAEEDKQCGTVVHIIAE